MRIVQLIRIDFDSTENHRPQEEKIVGAFFGDGEKSANGICDEWIRKHMLRPRMYLGYDGEVYPKFKIVEFEATNKV